MFGDQGKGGVFPIFRGQAAAFGLVTGIHRGMVAAVPGIAREGAGKWLIEGVFEKAKDEARGS
ncbi:hypothetical protein DYGSA30_16990 [Dyella sp. GSA-30]|nr:hypothetical protein DYGSA30_16990 [Dyella sp. GSA-30]